MSADPTRPANDVVEAAWQWRVMDEEGEYTPWVLCYGEPMFVGIEKQPLYTLTNIKQTDAVEAERARIADWFEGKGGVIPGAAAFAPLVSGNNQPCMSGDLRDRLRPQQRERFDAVMRDIAAAIRGAK